MEKELVKGWKFVRDEERECFKLLKVNDIVTDEGVEDAWIADVYEMADFLEFLGEEGGKGVEQTLADLPPSIQIDEHILWLTLNKFVEGYQAGYLHSNGLYEKAFTFTAPTPQEALKQLKAKLAQPINKEKGEI